MGKTVFFILLPVLNVYALRIHSVTVSPVSESRLDIGLNTEAEELYYFHCWQYAVSGNSILVEACFVPGFGSTINPLNNTFAIALDMTVRAAYSIKVRIYYTDLKTLYQPHDLQDEQSGLFFAPLTRTIILDDDRQEKKKTEVFPNPTDDIIHIPEAFTEVFVFDRYGRTIAFFTNTGAISLKYLADGLYLLLLDRRQTVRVLLKKQ